MFTEQDQLGRVWKYFHFSDKHLNHEKYKFKSSQLKNTLNIRVHCQGSKNLSDEILFFSIDIFIIQYLRFQEQFSKLYFDQIHLPGNLFEN